MVKRPVSLAVASELDVVEAGLRTLLAPFEDRITVVDASEGGRADVVLVELEGHADADLTRVERFARDLDVGHVALYARHVSTRMLREADRLGIRSIVSPQLPPRDLVAALLDVADGKVVTFGGPRERPRWLGRDDGLTERESQVLVLCAEGLTNREIADALYVNVETVKSHLKHAYSRLGLRNRTQAAAYVHGAAGARSVGHLDGDDVRHGHGAPDTHDPAAARSRAVGGDAAVDEAELAGRLALMGLDDERRRPLAALVDQVEAGAAEFVHSLFERWAAQPETATLLADPQLSQRLVEHQRRYLRDLFGGALDTRHAVAMTRMGVTHHRIGLSPQWYLTSYVHVICDHLPIVFAAAHDDHEAVSIAGALVSSVLFDASLVLDAYELSVAEDVVRRSAVGVGTVGSSIADDTSGGSADTTRLDRAMAKVSLAAEDETTARRRFVGLGDDTVARLHHLAPVVTAALPAVLDRFYDLVAGTPDLARLVDDDTAVRLRAAVARFWSSTTNGDFDRAHAAARVRLGTVHEYVGVSPQSYLAGLGQHLGGLLRALVRPDADLAADVDAVIRAAFFDMSFVIDAYLDARAQALLQTGRFASQVMSGLVDGIAIIDARNRVEYADEQLLDLVGASAAVLRRMPLDSALPIPGAVELVEAARDAPSGRVSGVRRLRGRELRVTAMRVERSVGGSGQVAVVLDDITELLRATSQHSRDDERFARIVGAVDAVAWEIDLGTGTLLAISGGAERLFGARPIDLLGTRLPPTLVPLDGLQLDGAARSIDHAVTPVAGGTRWCRTSLVVTARDQGEQVATGVTVDVSDLHDELGRLRDAVRRLEQPRGGNHHGNPDDETDTV